FGTQADPRGPQPGMPQFGMQTDAPPRGDQPGTPTAPQAAQAGTQTPPAPAKRKLTPIDKLSPDKLTPINKLPASARGRVAPVSAPPVPPAPVPPPVPISPPVIVPVPVPAPVVVAPPVPVAPAYQPETQAPPVPEVEPEWQLPKPRRRRRVLLGLAAAVVALAMVAAGLLVLQPWRTTVTTGTGDTGTGGTTTQPNLPLQPVLSGMAGNVPEASPQAVAAALDPVLGDPRLGNHVTVNVVDVVTGTALFGRGQGQPTTPASTMKLATALAALEVRGPAYQISTKVVAGQNPGEVVLVGGGDPTLAATSSPTYPGAARLSDLAAQVKKALGATAPTKVIVDSSLFTGPTAGPQWAPGDATGGQVSNITALMTDGARVNPKRVNPPSTRFTSPDLAAGQAFARLLGLPASAVSRGTAPRGGQVTQLGEVKSPPLVRLVELMLSASDNVIAEMVARQVALATNQPASFAGGAAAVIATLDKLGVPTAGARLYDGSGLATADKLTPQLLTSVLTIASRTDQPALHGLFTGLPVAGYSGTLMNRYHAQSSASGAGLVRAKTGTLTGVNALAGLVVDASGRLLAFAVMADRVTAGTLNAEAALDRVAAALVAVR
ncbi:MAG TPA: D-alanyl-D-alanine carboxypeptidase/D-alanyl-D-alanine-endopeptidase, partial [Rugosimonospora sp.]|nr:D-alanyl-D-alanine carboxypeptidase/D-alanyl-D-alanine-endopeptidase [Rugosimonospora sp.]